MSNHDHKDEDDDIELGHLPLSAHTNQYERDDDDQSDNDDEGNRALLGDSDENTKNGPVTPQKLWPQIKNIVTEVRDTNRVHACY